MFSFSATKQIILGSTVMLLLSGKYLKCSPDDLQPPSFKWKSSFILTDDDVLITCPSEGRDCKLVTQTQTIEPAARAAANTVYENFQQAYSTNSLESFYRRANWESVYPIMDESDMEILDKCRAGVWKPFILSDGTIVIIPSEAGRPSATNIQYTIKF